MTLSEPERLSATDITVASAIGTNYGPVTVSGSGSSYVITLAQPINKADRLAVTIDNPMITLFTRQLDVLPGDFNDDGVVNSQDLAGIRNEWLGIGGARPTIFGDINGDGTVNVLDYNAERLLIGGVLPPAFGANLLLNGDFSLGNTGFTSQYVYSTDLQPDDTYVVGDNPDHFHPNGANFGDHTTGRGLMLIADGSQNFFTVVWQETINVLSNVAYDFSGWAASWGEAVIPFGNGDPNPAFLDLSINGVQIGSDFPLPAQDGQWSQFSASWNSGTSSVATITIIDENSSTVS